MNLDKRDTHGKKCVANGDAGVRIGGGIDNDNVNVGIGRLLNSIYDLAFNVRLEGFQRD